MCEKGPHDGGTVSDQVGLKGAAYILTGEVSGDSDGAGEETADSSWLSERWMGL